MKRTLLAGLLSLGTMSVAASEFTPVFYDIPRPVDYVGTDHQGWSYINTGSSNEGFRVVNTNIEPTLDQVIANIDGPLKQFYQISDDTYVPGFFENYPEKPSTTQSYIQFKVDTDISDIEYKEIADLMILAAKSALKGRNYIYQSNDGFHVVEVTDNRILLTNGHDTFSGFDGDTVYSCPVGFIDLSRNLSENLQTCVQTDYKSAVAGWISGWYDSVNNNGYSVTRSLSGKKLNVIEPDGTINSTDELSFEPGRSFFQLFISSDNDPYIYSSDDNKTYVYKYLNGKFESVSYDDSAALAGIERIPGGKFILGNTKEELILFDTDQKLSFCKRDSANSSEISYIDYLESLAASEGGEFKILLENYPKKPDSYETVIVDLGVQEFLKPGFSDAEFKAVIDNELGGGYQEFKNRNQDIIGCAPGSLTTLSEKAIPTGVYENSGSSYVVYQKQTNSSSGGGLPTHSLVKIYNFSTKSEVFLASEILNSLGENHPFIKNSKSVFTAKYPSIDLSKETFSAEDIATLELYPEASQEEVRAFIDAIILQHASIPGMSANGGFFLTPIPVHLANGNINYHTGRFSLASKAPSKSVDVRATPATDVIDPYTNAVSSLEVITDGELFAADVSCTVAGPMDITSADYSNWGGSERLTLPLQWTSKDAKGVASLKGDVDSVSGEQQLLALDTLAEVTTADVTVNCAATVSDKNGNQLNVNLIPATIRLDDGIHGGTGVITGQVTLPAGVNSEDVTVEVTINGRTIRLNVDENGRFEFDELRDGDFTINVKSEHYTQSCINTQTTGSQIDLGNIELIAGDVNNDGEINIADFTYLAGRYGSAKGDERYTTQADLNSDDKVNIQDLAILGSHFGSRQCNP